jgi:hypothetical protein
MLRPTQAAGTINGSVWIAVTTGRPVLGANTFTPGIFSIHAVSSVTSVGRSEIIETGFIYSTDTIGGWEHMNMEKSGLIHRVTTLERVAATGAGAFRDSNVHRDRPFTPAAATTYFVRAYAINANNDTTYNPPLTAAPTSVATLAFSGGRTAINSTTYAETLATTTTDNLVEGLNRDSVDVTVIYSLTGVNDTTFMNYTTGVLRDTIHEYGFVWGFAASPTIADNRIVSNKKRISQDTFGIQFPISTTERTLHVRPYAISLSFEAAGTAPTYGTASSQLMRLPQANTTAAGAVTDSSATLNGNLIWNGGVALIEAGFQLTTVSGDYSDAVIVRPTAIPTAGMSASTIPLGRLEPGTTYHFRAFYINRWGMLTYGTEFPFTTLTSAVMAQRFRDTPVVRDALALTLATVREADRGRIEASIRLFHNMSAAVQSILAPEKALLDSLLAEITEDE